MQIKALAISGEYQEFKDEQQNNPAYPGLKHRSSIQVAGVQRSNMQQPTIEMLDNGVNLVELIYEDGTQWLGPTDMLEDLYPDGAKIKRGDKEVFEFSGNLEYPDATRGIGTIALKLVNIFFKDSLKEEAKSIVKELAGKVELKILGTSPGLKSVRNGLQLTDMGELNTAAPILLLLHGTGSSTQSSFEDAPGTELWKHWQETYGKNIIAFQHETLTKSPLENVLDLLKALPTNTTLHLVSHSRGGLVGEVLCRFSQSDTGDVVGFTDTERAAFAKAGQEKDAETITELRKLATQKQYKVEKFVRVACPAAGTTILAKRLDYFVNIILNLLGRVTGAGMHPAYMSLKELLIAVVDQKNDPDVLPGLEAMKPDSLFIRVLNSKANSSIPIVSPVAAIAGNCKVGFNLKSLFVIATKLFFGEENDLIVNTASMYHGSKKTNGLQYFFDEGKAVDHFSYFKNEKTKGAIEAAFKTIGAATISGFTPFVQGKPSESERNVVLGLNGVHFMKDNLSGKKPIVVLLPGIMGSAIEQKGDLIWINLLRFVAGDLERIGINTPKDTITIPGIISSSYKDLARYLSDAYDVVTFSFDWRQSLLDAANRFNEKIIELMKLNQPIKIIGHSMGGVLVRDFIIHYNSTWQILKKTEGFRLIFLGSPLNGSHRILSVLFGQDSIIKKLAMIDIVHNTKELLGIFSRFPGILCLLPISADAQGRSFADMAVWREMAQHQYEGIEDAEMKEFIPQASDLATFAEYRKFVLDAQKKGIDYGNAIYVAGKDNATPCDYRLDNSVRGRELTILSTAEGDQSVTWEGGIPTELNKNNVYYVNVTHGSLASTASMFAGIGELLNRGETNLFSRNRPVVRGGAKKFKQPQVVDMDLSQSGMENSLMGIGSGTTMMASELPVKVRVSHGDLKYAAYPLLAGHFKNDSILYAEDVINKQLEGLLANRHSVGVYPGDIGSSHIQLTQQPYGFPGAIIVGLGEPGTLNSFGLSHTITQAVTKYLLDINGSDKIKAPLYYQLPLGISSLIIGCGYGGLSIENSINAILEGILTANQKVKSLYEENAKLIEQVQFVELYEDRLLACYYTLHNLCNLENGLLNITLQTIGIEKLKGGRKRVNLLQSEDWWNRIEVRKTADSKGKAKGMKFVLSSSRARQDERDEHTATSMVEKLAKVISTDFKWDKAKARALYELLVPNDFKDEVKKYGNIVWVLDNYTAGFPWELLHDKTTGAKPLCIDAGMIRQLIRQNGRTKIEMVSSKTALVVGDPNLKGYITQLSGALEEAKTVATLLDENGYKVIPLLRSSPEEIIPAMFSADYKIIHLAGHGEFNEDPDKDSGMVIGDGIYLTTGEIAKLSGTSELVFVNCCFLGQTDGHAEALFQQRYKLAANIGTQLIDNGVKAVIVAGWAVDDAAALDFAKRFYKAMLEGYTFGDAVRLARMEVYNKHSDTNTWGAYQCYGDPFYRLLNEREKPMASKHRYVLAEQAEVDLYNLLSDLDAMEAKVDTERILNKLLQISREVDECQLRNQLITEREAFIYIKLNMADAAVAKFEALQTFKDADYSFRAIEQLFSLRTKKLYQLADENKMAAEEILNAFDGVREGLEALIHIRPTTERYSLLGGIYKRKAVLSMLTNDDKKTALQSAASAYWNGYCRSADTDAAYPLSNWIALQCILGQANAPLPPNGPTQHTTIADLLAYHLQKIKEVQTSSTTYYDNVLKANLLFCEWLLEVLKAKTGKMPSSTIVEQAYQYAWGKYASEADKKAELTNFEILQKTASIDKGSKRLFTALNKLIGTLKG